MAREKTVDRERGARIRHIRRDILGIDSQEKFAEVLSEASGFPLSRGAVGNWEQGKDIGIDNMRVLAELANVSIDWIAYAAGDQPTRERVTQVHPDADAVRLVGYVGAGAAAHFYAVDAGSLELVDAPPGSTKDTVAVEIRGTSLGELFQHWLIYYDDVRSPITSDLIGKLCVVGLIDDRILVKQVRRAKTPGHFDLLSNTEEPMRDIEVLWAAKVKNMVPRG